MSGTLGRFFVWTMVLSVPSHALIFDHDDRTFAQSDDSQFQSIGLVKSNIGSGTGFLVDDCHVLTSRHIQSEHKEILGAELVFVPRDPSIRPVKGRVIARGEGAAAFIEQANRNRSEDWLLFRLYECVGAKLGFVALNGEPSKIDAKLMNAGFPIDRPKRAGLSIDPSCRVHYITKVGVLHDCAFLPGNSGGPLFDIEREGGRLSLRAVAIGSAGFRERDIIAFDPLRANVATPIAPLLPILRKHLRPLFKGTNGADQFKGSGLFDRLEGGGGKDTFTLDSWGSDTLAGGAGADLFKLGPSSGLNHLVADFNPLEGDVLDFSSIDADHTQLGIQTFKLREFLLTSTYEGYAIKVCNKTHMRTNISLFVKHRGYQKLEADYQITLNGCSSSIDGIVGLS